MDKPDVQGRLTAREAAIMEAVGRGLDRDAVAAELGLSPAMVSAHIHHILSKLAALPKQRRAKNGRRFEEFKTNLTAADEARARIFLERNRTDGE